MERLRRVSETARELGISERWLRQAENGGRIPKAKRNFNGWRVYTEKDIESLKKLLLPDSNTIKII